MDQRRENDMKKKMQMKDYINNMKQKKEELPFHKMDDVSRRQFIQSVGFFLGALTIPSMIRLETMSKLSKKILGNSMAYAADFSSGAFNIEVLLRSGFSSRWIVGEYNDNTSLAVNANVPWATGVTSTATTGVPVILGPNAGTLAPFAGAIQHVVGDNESGHTNMFQSTYRSGLGEVTALRAATEASTSTTVLKAPFVFGDTSQVAVQNLPTSLAEFTPIAFSNAEDASAMFTPPTFKTNEGNELGDTLQNNVLTIINNKFNKDILAGVLQKDVTKITASNDQALAILQSGYSTQLDPGNPANAAKMAALTTGLPGDMGTLNVMGMDPTEIIFVLLQAATLGITPMIGTIIGTTGDWHPINSLPAGDGSGDDREVTGEYFAKLFANVCTAASTGVWENAVTGNPQEVRIHVSSEFARGFVLTDGDTNNNDGGHSTLLTIGSKATQSDYKPGSIGGSSNTGAAIGFNPTSDSHSTAISLFDIDQMFGHHLNMLKIDKDLLNLNDFPGITGLMS